MYVGNDVYIRHYKGGLYRLLNDSVKCEATGQRLVLYEAILSPEEVTESKQTELFVRPYDEFFGYVSDKDGNHRPRFLRLQIGEEGKHV